MTTAAKRKPAIQRLVDHMNGPVATAKAIADDFPYQAVQRWTARGWGSPKYFNKLVPLLPEGLTIDDLFADVEAVQKAA